MGKLNDNNFLIWEGQFSSAPFDVIANSDNISMVVNEPSKVINVLANDVASYGIDKPSLEITLQDNPAKLATYNQVSGEVTYYPPAGIAPGQVRQLKYRWYDNAGHVSNEGTISITINDRPTAWRGYAPSYRCLKDGDNKNTGQAIYDTLEKYYTDNGAAYSPATLKNNTIGNPDYIPASENLLACPLPTATVPLYVWNDVPNPPSIAINDVILKRGGVVIASFYLNNGGSPGFQPSQIKVEPGAQYDEVVVRMTLINTSAAGNHIVTFHPGAGGIGSSAQGVNFPAQSGAIVAATFVNITFGTQFAGDITLE